MIYLHSDYSQGAHPAVLDALVRTNFEHTDGYGLDPHCENAGRMIKELIGQPDCHVHMMVGGTPCNITVIAASLRPYESVIAARTGHAYFHETGGVEATGHRIVTAQDEDGRLTPEGIDRAMTEFSDEHTPKPGLVYISQPTELGTIYSKAQLTAISEKCRELGLLLYIDGARLAAALTCRENDTDIRELAALCDAFYIGGTKNGAMFGEALVIRNERMNDHFRWMIKRQGGLLAKGRLIGVQFEALMEGGENSVFFTAAAHANRLAERLRQGLTALRVSFRGASPTNQVFPILPAEVVKELRKDFFFYDWEPEKDGMITVRLVTSWGTEEKDVDAFIARTGELLRLGAQ